MRFVYACSADGFRFTDRNESCTITRRGRSITRRSRETHTNGLSDKINAENKNNTTDRDGRRRAVTYPIRSDLSDRYARTAATITRDIAARTTINDFSFFLYDVL